MTNGAHNKLRAKTAVEAQEPFITEDLLHAIKTVLV